MLLRSVRDWAASTAALSCMLSCRAIGSS
jgi:hypothetical protein